MSHDVIDRYKSQLEALAEASNLRRLPAESTQPMIDLTSNDYLGIAERADLRDEFYATAAPSQLMLTSSASRLLASRQGVYGSLEGRLSQLYGGREALLFNSGYHANTGMVSALADSKTMILADRLVHASIIDGIKLSNGSFTRFRHNDYDHLVALIEKHEADYETLLVIVESVYSMDGDYAEIDRLIDIKRRYPKVMLYVDEAHAFGVEGPGGLGLVAASAAPEMVDVMVGTLGKAAASSGAFAIVNTPLRDYFINKSRSLIFSTAIAPVNAAWSLFVIDRIIGMDTERARLKALGHRLSAAIGSVTRRGAGGNCAAQNFLGGHIQPLIVGDARLALDLSAAMAADGVKVLPIRTPTVPPRTERLRFSLNSALTDSDIEAVAESIKKNYEAVVNK